MLFAYCRQLGRVGRVALTLDGWLKVKYFQEAFEKLLLWGYFNSIVTTYTSDDDGSSSGFESKRTPTEERGVTNFAAVTN